MGTTMTLTDSLSLTNSPTITIQPNKSTNPPFFQSRFCTCLTFIITMGAGCVIHTTATSSHLQLQQRSVVRVGEAGDEAKML
jgi:hypothetical protein